MRNIFLIKLSNIIIEKYQIIQYVQENRVKLMPEYAKAVCW